VLNKYIKILLIISLCLNIINLFFLYKNNVKSSNQTKIEIKKDVNIESTIRLKETGCTYLVFDNGQIVPEYNLDGKVVGCGK
jgi:hypothetical protein